MRQNKRRLSIGLILAAAVPLAIASVAYACQRITPMHATPASGAAGSQIQVSGTNFSRAATSSDVTIRLDRRDGPVLASIPATSLEPVGSDTGKFTTTVTIPADVAIGNHILIGTQTLANGQPCVGCPGRANFEVTAAGAQAASNQTAAGPAAADQERAPDAGAASEPSGYSEPAAQPVPAQSAASQPAPAVVAPSAPAHAAATAAPASATTPVQSSPVAPVSEAVATEPAVSPASPVVEAPAAVTQPATAEAPANIGLVPAGTAHDTTSPLPRLALAAALAMVLMGLLALWRSGRPVEGGALSPAA